MMVNTSTRTYATHENAITALDKACGRLGISKDDVNIRWMIACRREDELRLRFNPVVVNPPSHLMLPLASAGVMVVG